MIPGVFGVAACSSRSRHDGAVSTLDCLLVGAFHMANPSADMVNLQADDVLAPARQREIAAIVVGLERFRPTKVLLEHPHDDSSVIRRYRDYRDGSRALGRTETEQLGFRLAAACGHEQVHPVDVVDKFYEDRIEELIVESKYAASWRELRSSAERSVDHVATILRNGTIGEALHFANAPEERRAMLTPYLDALLPIAGDGNWSGPEMVANWYRRNFKIAARIHAVAEDGDRLVVIFGAGHIPVLEHVLGASQRFRLVDPLDFLPVR